MSVMSLAGLVHHTLTAAPTGVTAMAGALETTVGTDPFTWLVNLGAVGVVVVLLITGQLRTKAEVENLQRENANKDQKIAEKDAALAAVQRQLLEQTLPALAKSTQVIERVPTSTSSEQDLIAELHETQQMLRNIVENNQSRPGR